MKSYSLKLRKEEEKVNECIVLSFHKQIKNFIKELAHNPGKLVLYIILIAGISVSVFSRFFSPEDEALNFVADISFLHGGYIGAMLLIALPILLRGLKIRRYFLSYE